MRKRVLSVLMTLCMVLTLLPLPIAATTPEAGPNIFNENGFGYEIQADGSGGLTNTVKVKYFTGHWDRSGEFILPAQVTNSKTQETYQVVGIEPYAFSVDPPGYAEDNTVSIIIEAPLLEIDDNAFAWDARLGGGDWIDPNYDYITKITLPSTVTKIGDDAFNGCRGLQELEISSTITEIGSGAFYGCENLKFDFATLSNVTSLGEDAFNGCTSATGVADLSKLTDIEIPEAAFIDCTGLTGVTMSDAVTSIGINAFNGCTALESVEFSDNLKSVGQNAFVNCTGLKQVNFPNTLTVLSTNAFSGSGLTSVVLPDSVTTLGGNTFLNCTDLTSVTLPSSLTTIGSADFSGCTGLTDLNLPDGLSVIGEFMFSGCTGLTSIEIPSSVQTIDQFAFSACHSLTAVTFNEGLKSIGQGAFRNCERIPSVTIPASVSKIGPDAFYVSDQWSMGEGYSRMTDATILATTAPESSSYPFPSKVTIHVPENATGYDVSPWTRYTIERFEQYLPNASMPSINTGLIYNGTEQTGVNSGTGYTLSGSITATNAGTYTATATLESGYQWPDGTTAPKIISWSIAKADREIKIAEVPQLFVDGQTANIQFTSDSASSDGPTYTYSSSNPAVATVNERGVVTPVGAGTATITVTAPATINYKEGSATATVTVSALPKQTVTFDQEGDQDAVYGDAAIENKATSAQGGTVTYISTNPNVATVDEDGTVTIVGAGETTIQATAAAVEGYAPTTASYKLTVAPKEITATASVADKTFDGTNEATVTNVAFEGVVGDDEVAYDATAAFADPNVGTGKTVTVIITIDDPNYTLSNGTITLNNGVITQAEAPVIPDRTISVHFGDTAKKTFDLSDLMPANAGTTTFTRGEVTDNNGNVLSVYEVQEDTFVYQLSEGLTEENAGTTVTVPVTITSQNYKEATAKLMISITDKWTPEVSAEDITVTYTGNPVPDSAIKGTATVNGILVEGAWSFAEGQTPVNVKDSGNKTVVFTPTDLNVYTTAQDTVLVTISKADPDGEPSYTAITGSGHTLADAALNKGTIAIPGAIVWDNGDDTVVEANTAYGWTFTPEDADNYNILTGTITPYVRSSGGGSGSGSSSTTRYSVTVKNSDNGDVEANVSRAAKGDTVTLTVTPDEGYVLDTLTVTAANGDKINLNRGSNGRYTFEMPASRVTVEATFVEEGGEEAAEPFVDVSAGDWFYDAVVYVYDNGLMSGTAATTFGPNVGTTRGMIATILWRLAGSPNGGANPFTDVSSSDYYAEAVAWAAGEGIVGGYGNGVFGANDPITREQMALMMYRYAQYAGYETSQRSAQLSSYADYASISDWAVEAVSWANAVGLMNGRTASTIVPTGTITRAEAATILMQFGENVQK